MSYIYYKVTRVRVGEAMGYYLGAEKVAAVRDR